MVTPLARVACAVILRVELYDEADGAGARLAIEEGATAAARANATAATPTKLNPNAGPLGQEQPKGSSRPSFALPPLLPLDWKVTFNSFRVADELEITIPASALPVPATAIRALTVSAVVQQVDADVWAEGLAANDLAARLFVGTEGTGDFEGVCTNVGDTGHGLPTRKLRFLDYVGLLAAKNVVVGAVLDRALPVSEAVRAFLVGSPAEGLPVEWVDTEPEPALGKMLPKGKGKAKNKAAAAPFAGQKYLDVLTRECGLVGVVPRVDGTTLRLAYAGTIYEGRDRGGAAKATMLLGSTIEEFETSHDLIGGKIHTVGVTCYDPDTGRHLMGRWPPDPKGATPVVAPGKPPRLPPIAANVGLPGAAQLDESILMVPGPPCGDPRVVQRMAQAIFLERTRQKVKHTIRTHAPWDDADAANAWQGPLLRLRAGDNVRFGVVTDPDALVRPELRAIASGSDAGATAALLRQQGVKPDVASRVADAIAKAPVTSLFRVDTMTVAGGKEAAQIELVLTNFTVIESDLAAKATGKTLADFAEAIGKLVEVAVSRTADEIDAAFAGLFKDVNDSDLPSDEKPQVHDGLQAAHAQATKGRR